MPCGGLPAWMPGSQSRNEVSWAGTLDDQSICLLVRAAAGACCGDKSKNVDSWIATR